jgi:hypothetical protein
VTEREELARIIDPGAFASHRFSGGPDGQLVFGLAAGGPEERQSDEVSAAKAALIAAAPAMLEALRLAAAFIGEEADNREYAGSEHSDYEREPRDLVNRINAAIDLATGETK